MLLRKNYLLGFIRTTMVVLWILFMPIVFLLARLLRVPRHQQLIPFFHAGLCRIFGIQVHVSGTLSEQRPTLYVSNHVSYLDVFLLGFLPAYFIAKSEVAGWPILGKLAALQNTLFVERRVGSTKHQLAQMQDHLKAGKSLTLFAEGTSTDGLRVEPFKSSLFEAANLDDSTIRVAIQPITVAYTHYAGKRISDQAVRDHYAWYARMPFSPHFFGLMPLRNCGAKVHLHPVCYLDQFATRKACAEHCQKLVAQKLHELNHND